MTHRLQTPRGRALYALRKQTPEPVFGIIKSVLGFRQFLLRGSMPSAASDHGVEPEANVRPPPRPVAGAPSSARCQRSRTAQVAPTGRSKLPPPGTARNGSQSDAGDASPTGC
jgi:hypothetical protein